MTPAALRLLPAIVALTHAQPAVPAPKLPPVRIIFDTDMDTDCDDAGALAVLVAARGTGRPWRLVTRGHNHLFPNGTHEWREEPDNPAHAYISALAEGEDPRAVAAAMESLMTARRAGE